MVAVSEWGIVIIHGGRLEYFGCQVSMNTSADIPLSTWTPRIDRGALPRREIEATPAFPALTIVHSPSEMLASALISIGAESALAGGV